MKTKRSKLVCIVGLILLVLIIFVPAKPIYAASSSYTTLIDDNDWTKPVKKGNYYFKVSSKSYTILQSKTKTGGYKNTKMPTDALGNETKAYYVEDNILYKYTYSTGTTVTLKKLSISSSLYEYEYYTDLGYVYGDKVYINAFIDFKPYVYAYDLKTKTYKKLKGSCEIAVGKGAYVLARADYRTDVSTDRVFLYKLTSTGLTKVKYLATYGYLEPSSVYIGGGYVYYVKYPSEDMSYFTLYKYSISSGTSTKIKTIKSPTGFCVPQKVTPTYIMYHNGNKIVKYTY